MAQLFLESERDARGAWDVATLDGDAYRLSPGGVAALDRPRRPRQTAGAAMLLRIGQGRDACWLVLCGARDTVRVNGAPLSLGARRLQHRDELVVRDPQGHTAVRLFFSTERVAQVEPFPGSEPLPCPRCKTLIHQGEAAVQCPHPECGVWHHMNPDGKKCWTYSEHCAARCGWKTALGGELTWSPSEL